MLFSAKMWTNNVCVAFLLIPNLVNFIFNDDPDRVSKNLVIGSLHFTADSFTNKGTIRCRIFKIIETKRCCAGFITWSLLLCLFLQIV